MIWLLMFALAFGSPDMSFPWYVWVVAGLHAAFFEGTTVYVKLRKK